MHNGGSHLTLGAHKCIIEVCFGLGSSHDVGLFWIL
jgi:hypothetical protein